MKQPGYILLLTLLLASAGLLLAVSIGKTQAEIFYNFDAKYKENSGAGLEKYLYSPETWKTYTNEKYKYVLKYPRIWRGAIDKNIKFENPFERSIPQKVALKVEVSTQNTDLGNDKFTVSGNTFYVLENTNTRHTLLTKKGDSSYIIDFWQTDYFQNPTDFNSTFTNLVKNFHLF